MRVYLLVKYIRRPTLVTTTDEQNVKYVCSTLSRFSCIRKLILWLREPTGLGEKGLNDWPTGWLTGWQTDWQTALDVILIRTFPVTLYAYGHTRLYGQRYCYFCIVVVVCPFFFFFIYSSFNWNFFFFVSHSDLTTDMQLDFAWPKSCSAVSLATPIDICKYTCMRKCKFLFICIIHEKNK